MANAYSEQGTACSQLIVLLKNYSEFGAPLELGGGGGPGARAPCGPVANPPLAILLAHYKPMCVRGAPKGGEGTAAPERHLPVD